MKGMIVFAVLAILIGTCFAGGLAVPSSKKVYIGISAPSPSAAATTAASAPLAQSSDKAVTDSGASAANAATTTAVSASYTAVNTMVQSRLYHSASNICSGTGSKSYWDVDDFSTGMRICASSIPPQLPSGCAAPVTVACVDTVKISSPSAFTAPDGNTVSTIYYDPIGQFTSDCYQNRIAAPSNWMPMIYWKPAGYTCYRWAFADDPRMSPGLNMLVRMPAAENGGYPGGFYFPGYPGFAGAIGYREITSSNGFNLVTMPINNLGTGSSSTTGSWGIGAANLSLIHI